MNRSRGRTRALQGPEKRISPLLAVSWVASEAEGEFEAKALGRPLLPAGAAVRTAVLDRGPQRLQFGCGLRFIYQLHPIPRPRDRPSRQRRLLLGGGRMPSAAQAAPGLLFGFSHEAGSQGIEGGKEDGKGVRIAYGFCAAGGGGGCFPVPVWRPSGVARSRCRRGSRDGRIAAGPPVRCEYCRAQTRRSWLTSGYHPSVEHFTPAQRGESAHGGGLPRRIDRPR